MELILDVYEPAPSDAPLAPVILIHGGAGKFGDRSLEADRTQGLAANGYVAFNIEYLWRRLNRSPRELAGQVAREIWQRTPIIS